jgi:hypothetical protein
MSHLNEPYDPEPFEPRSHHLNDPYEPYDPEPRSHLSSLWTLSHEAIILTNLNEPLDPEPRSHHLNES